MPHRPAVLAAKMLATLDVLSGGRLVVGIGAGWLKSEFDAVVTTPFPERGKVTDEYIDAFRVLWTEAKPKFAGKYVKFDGIVLEPKPVQKPLRRSGSAARACTRSAAPRVWPRPGIRSAATTSTCSTRCRGSKPASPACARRRPKRAAIRRSMGVSFRVKRYGAAVPAKATDGERRLFSGSEADLIADFRALKKAGVSAIDIDFGGRRPPTTILAEMKRFRAAVIEKI